MVSPVQSSHCCKALFCCVEHVQLSASPGSLHEPRTDCIMDLQASLVGTPALPSYWLHDAVARGDTKVRNPPQLAAWPCWVAFDSPDGLQGMIPS
jgi:hypothetical protein